MYVLQPNNRLPVGFRQSSGYFYKEHSREALVSACRILATNSRGDESGLGLTSANRPLLTVRYPCLLSQPTIPSWERAPGSRKSFFLSCCSRIINSGSAPFHLYSLQLMGLFEPSLIFSTMRSKIFVVGFRRRIYINNFVAPSGPLAQ